MAVLTATAGAFSFRASLAGKALRERRPWLLLLLTFIAWATASSLWSSWPAHSQAPKLLAITVLSLMFTAAAVADPDARRLTRAGMLAAFVVLTLLVSFEAVTHLALNRVFQPDLDDGNLERNPARGVIILLGMVWAVAGVLAARGGPWRTGLAALALLTTAALSLQFHQLVSLAAFAAGLAALGVGAVAPRFGLIAVTVGWAIWMLAAPIVSPLLARPEIMENVPLSWAARIGIWEYTCAHIGEQFWIGHGLDASRAVSERIEVRGLGMRGIPLHPHSGSLQIWYECGVIGALLAAAALVTGGLALARRLTGQRVVAAAACATIASYGVIFNVSFGAWQEWWNAVMFVAAACVGAIGFKAAKA
ncbi:O-antigen ligase family protein [Terricaulis sp.]|uniref:O-antigen ligase family protein n=1 Tax=Terricaulis sp. TaxID=2768686 RepID=UPI0037850AC0